ncbi:MAG: MFS transporter [Chloroflexota bacterium]|nr:MFS transporter [Chloroflexota bacterium]
MLAIESRGRRLAMLVALATGGLLSTATTVGITPFLLDIARDLNTDLGAAGNLVALQSVTWGLVSLFAGAASDRLGRRPLLIAGLVILVISGVGVAAADNYAAVAVWRLFGGLGGGTFMGTVFATVSDHFPAAERGRSLGWVVTGQSLALVLGVPAMTLAGTVGGWRGAVLAHALMVLMCTAAVWMLVPRRSERAVDQPVPFSALARLVGPRVLALLLAGSSERVCYAAVAVFLPTYLVTRYAIDPPHLALGLLLVALGNLFGNLLGGHLSDRLRAPQAVLAFSLVAAGAMALPVLSWAPAVEVSIGLGFVYTLVNATGRPALLTVLSQVSNEARGAVLGLNITFSSLGWLGATALGGLVVGVAGFGGLALLTLAFGLAGGAVCAATWLLPRRLARSRPLIARVAPGER